MLFRCYFQHYKEELLLFLKLQSNRIKSLILVTTLLFVLFSGKIEFENYELVEPILFGCLFSLCLFIFIPNDNYFKREEAEKKYQKTEKQLQKKLTNLTDKYNSVDSSLLTLNMFYPKEEIKK